MSNYSFLIVGKTQESKEAQEFKRYVGLGSSFILAVNPTKKELEEIYGREQANDPEYVVSTDNGKEARVSFIVKTDPEKCGGIEMINRVTFTLRNTPAYNKDESKVQVIDDYGNTTWADTDTAKAGKALPTNAKIDQTHYRMAANGEPDLVAFLKAYLCVPSALDYLNGAWSVKKDASAGQFKLEHIKDYFNGDFSEIKGAVEMQPNNKVKLLYGVRTSDDNKQYQAVATKGELILRNDANATVIARLEKDLASAKNSGLYANTDYRVQELQEYSVEPTNLEAPVEQDNSSEMPWD